MGELIPGVLMGLLSVGGLAILPSVWRGTSPFLERGGHGCLTWLWGERIGKGFVRGIAPAVLGCAGLSIAVVAIALDDGSSPIARVGFMVFLVAVTLLALIILVNQPRFLVPPALRDEPGALARNRRQDS